MRATPGITLGGHARVIWEKHHRYNEVGRVVELAADAATIEFEDGHQAALLRSELRLAQRPGARQAAFDAKKAAKSLPPTPAPVEPSSALAWVRAAAIIAMLGAVPSIVATLLAAGPSIVWFFNRP